MSRPPGPPRWARPTGAVKGTFGAKEVHLWSHSLRECGTARLRTTLSTLQLET